MTIYEDADIKVFEDQGDTLILDKHTGETRLATSEEQQAAWDRFTTGDGA